MEDSIDRKNVFITSYLYFLYKFNLYFAYSLCSHANYSLSPSLKVNAFNPFHSG